MVYRGVGFGIVRRGAPSYVPQGSDRERNVVILNVGGIPVGFRATSSKTWYYDK